MKKITLLQRPNLRTYAGSLLCCGVKTEGKRDHFKCEHRAVWLVTDHTGRRFHICGFCKRKFLALNGMKRFYSPDHGKIAVWEEKPEEDGQDTEETKDFLRKGRGQ